MLLLVVMEEVENINGTSQYGTDTFPECYSNLIDAYLGVGPSSDPK